MKYILIAMIFISTSAYAQAFEDALKSSAYGDSQVMQCAGQITMSGGDTFQAIQDCQASINARRQASAQYQQQQNTDNRQIELLEKQNKLLEEQNRKLDMIQMDQFMSLNSKAK